jgi:uncharacterized protein YuzE
MKIEYDDANDVIHFTLSGAKIECNESLHDGFTVVYDKDRNVAGLEIRHASKNTLFEKFVSAAITSLRESAAEDRSFSNMPLPVSSFSVSDTVE